MSEPEPRWTIDEYRRRLRQEMTDAARSAFAAWIDNGCRPEEDPRKLDEYHRPTVLIDTLTLLPGLGKDSDQ
jgi:hypothetical protein